MKILAFAEQRDGKLKKTAFEVVRAARTIADQTGGQVVALLIGSNVKSIGQALGVTERTKWSLRTIRVLKNTRPLLTRR
jgi:electron transfer flavoprotein alpha subunit